MRTLSYLFLCVLLAIAGSTFADNLIVQPIAVEIGEQADVAIELENPDRAYIMTEFYLSLPQGISIAKDEEGELLYVGNSARFDRTHSLVVEQGGDGKYHFLIYSSKNKPLKGNSGALLTMTLQADANVAPGQYEGRIFSQVFSDENKKEYNPVDVTFAITVVEHPVTITAKSYTREYGEANPTFEFTTEGSELVGTPAISCDATVTSPVGTYPITVSVGSVANGNVTYVAGTLTITKAPLNIAAGTYTKKQGEEMPEFTLTYTGFKNNETKDVLTKQPVVSCTATVASEPGEYPVTVSGAEAQNYEINHTDGKLTVIPADPVIITAKSYTREYGNANPTFEFTTEGTALDGVPEISCEATAASSVGTYDIVVRKGTVKNYNVTYVAGTLTITKAPLNIAAGTYTKKQGEAMPEFTLTYTGFKNDETKDVLTKQATVSCSATVASEPGEYPVTVSGAEAQNYDISYTDGKLTVIPADAVIVKAKSYTREYGEANPTFEFTTEGVALDGVPEISCEATATSPVGTYDIIVKKGSVKNFNVTYVAGTLTITKAPLNIAAGTYTKKQGEEMPEFTLTYTGFKNNETKDVLTKQATVSCTATVASGPGEYPVTVSGAEAQNYDISYTDGKLVVEESAEINSVIANGSSFDVFTLDGRMVRRQVSSFKGLAKGMYIVNSRKIVVK
jgi:hypothetical protein